MATSNFILPKTYKIIPRLTGINGVDLTTSRVSSSIGTEGFTQMSALIEYTYSAATAVSWVWEASLDGGTTWGRIPTKSLSAGTITLAASTNTLVGTADFDIFDNFPINYPLMRLTFSGSGSPDASDLVTCTIRLSTQ